jgi:hypothetical protein
MLGIPRFPLARERREKRPREAGVDLLHGLGRYEPCVEAALALQRCEMLPNGRAEQDLLIATAGSEFCKSRAH